MHLSVVRPYSAGMGRWEGRGGERMGPVEASAERRNRARVGTLSFSLLRHLPNAIF